MQPLTERHGLLQRQESDDDDGEGFKVGEQTLYDASNSSEDDGQVRWRRRRRTEANRGLLYTKKEEQAVVKRLDVWLVGSLAVLYMLRYVRRLGGAPMGLLIGFGE